MRKERREKTRVPFKTEVVVKAGDSEIVSNAFSKDISIKGMFIETDVKIPAGTPCVIEIKLTGTSSKLSLRMTGNIVLQNKSGLGIVFNSIDYDSYFHLKNLLMYNASDPAALEKEGFDLNPTRKTSLISVPPTAG